MRLLLIRYRTARNWYNNVATTRAREWFSLNNIHNIKQLCVQNAWMSRDNVGFSRIMRQHSHSLHVIVCDRIRATVTRSSHYYTKQLPVIQLITHKLFLLPRAIITETRVFRNAPRTSYARLMCILNFAKYAFKGLLFWHCEPFYEKCQED